MKKGFWAILILAGTFFIVPSIGFAQKAKQENSFKENHTPFGRRKKEKKNQSTAGKIRKGGLFSFKKKQKSGGHADAFASHSIRGGHGFVYRFFHPRSEQSKNASLRKTKPGKVQNREQPRLFHRLATKNKIHHEQVQSRNRKARASRRRRFGD